MPDDLPEADRPRGLLGLIVWPFQALVAAGLRLAASLVQGVLAALLAPWSRAGDDGEPPPE